MNKKKRTIILSGIAFAFVAVLIPLIYVFSGGQASGKTFPNGISFVYLNNEDGKNADTGQVVLVQYDVLTPQDSVIYSTREFSADPVPRLVAEPQFYGDVSIVYTQLSKGDSVQLQVMMDSLQFQDQKPGWYEQGKNLRINLKCYDITTVEAYEAQMKVKDSLNMITESKTIESYLEKNNIQATKTSGGVFISVTKEGNGTKVTQGKTVTMNYTGKLMDGTIFDSSLNPGRKPMNYVFGVQQMIPGFAEAISTMSEGEKATFIIPSMLAYGPQAQGPIPANSILIFEVDILNVK